MPLYDVAIQVGFHPHQKEGVEVAHIILDVADETQAELEAVDWFASNYSIITHITQRKEA